MGRNDQGQIILFWTHYAKIHLSGEVYNSGKGGREENINQQSVFLNYSDNGCTVGRPEGLGYGQIIMENIYVIA